MCRHKIIKKENEEAFRSLIDQRAGRFLEVEYAFQELTDLPEGYEVPAGREKPWGTGHAVLAARHVVDGPFAVINADDYYGPGAFQSMYSFLEQAEDTDKYQDCMVGYPLENTLTENGYVSRGICETTISGMLEKITERTRIQWQDEEIVYEDESSRSGFAKLTRGTTVSMNFWGFTPSMMKELEAGFPSFLDTALAENPMKGEYYLPFVVNELLKEGKASVRVLRTPDQWYGVTYREDKAVVTAALTAMEAEGLYRF